LKAILSLRRHRYMARIGIMLVVLALIAGAVGCDEDADPPLDLEIRTWSDLNDVRDNLGGNHRLMHDLDSTTAGYEELAGPTANGGQGWLPIGDFGGFFSGTFDGQGFEIRDLFIDRPAAGSVGLFAVITETGTVENLGIADSFVTGGTLCGGLVAYNLGTVSNSYFSGNVTGYDYVGGLVGTNFGGTVNQSYSSGSVTGETGEGAGGRIGGLAGNSTGTISNCYSTASATGNQYVGGLVGGISSGTVEASYATGNVTGEDYVGGLVGSAPVGAVSNSFWDKESSGTAESDGGTGKTTTEMMSIATFNDTTTVGLDEPWDISAVAFGGADTAHTWNIVDGETYPFLSWQAGS